MGHPEITPEAIRWEASPGEPPRVVRSAIRAAIGDVWPEVPESAAGFAPHVSLAYSNAAGLAAPVAQALDQVKSEPATARLEGVELIVLNRDRQMYEWERFARVPLG
ncbi:2'-5' RNA ligase family protein [Streptomyces stramineus]